MYTQRCAFEKCTLDLISCVSNKMDLSTGKPINVCNGLNDGDCEDAASINKKKARRAHKRAAPGDPDYAAQEAADAKMMASK